MQSRPRRTAKPTYWKLSGDGSGLLIAMLFLNWVLPQSGRPPHRALLPVKIYRSENHFVFSESALAFSIVSFPPPHDAAFSFRVWEMCSLLKAINDQQSNSQRAFLPPEHQLDVFVDEIVVTLSYLWPHALSSTMETGLGIGRGVGKTLDSLYFEIWYFLLAF